jgi:hypothetical protein
LNEPETEGIVRNKGKSKTSHGESWRSLPLTRAGAAPFRIVGGEAPAVVTRHGSWGCAGDWEKKASGWQRFEGQRLGKELGAPTVLFIGLVKRIVASDRGTYPEKLGRWRGFLDRFAVGPFGIQS